MRAAIASVSVVAIATALFGARFAPREHVPLWLGLFFASALVLGAAGAALLRADLGRKRFTHVVLAGALVLRVAALVAPLSLSDDAYRYVWDGALLADGRDPYASRPDAITPPAGLGDDALERMNSPHYFTVYPPLAQGAFALSVFIGRAFALDPTLAVRAIFIAAELFAVFALLRVSERFGARPWVLLYAWHPLAFWEVAAGGHSEALMLPFLVLGAGALLDDRIFRAAALFGLAASAKLTALLALPVAFAFAFRRIGWRALWLALAPLVLALGFLPFASVTLIPNIGESLALYSETFSFNAPVYYGARHLLGYREGLTDPVDWLLMPALTALTLGALAALAHAQDGRPQRLARGLAFSFAAYLLLSRVIHPWYALPVLALGVLAKSRALVLLALLLPLSYLRYHPLGYESPLVIAAIFVPVAITMVLEGRARRRASPR